MRWISLRRTPAGHFDVEVMSQIPIGWLMNRGATVDPQLQQVNDDGIPNRPRPIFTKRTFLTIYILKGIQQWFLSLVNSGAYTQ